jgi:hypothetical protein
VSLAKKYLLGHPEACKVSHRGTASKTGEQPEVCKVEPSSHGGTQPRSKFASKEHEHGSLNCIVAFLGESNWSRSKVDRIIQASTKLE